MLRLQKLKFDLKSELEVLIPYSVLLLNFPQRLLTVATQLQEGLSSRLNCGGKTFKNSAFQPQQTGPVVIFYLSLETMPNDVHHRSLWICPLKWPQPSWVLFLPSCLVIDTPGQPNNKPTTAFQPPLKTNLIHLHSTNKHRAIHLSSPTAFLKLTFLKKCHRTFLWPIIRHHAWWGRYQVFVNLPSYIAATLLSPLLPSWVLCLPPCLVRDTPGLPSSVSLAKPLTRQSLLEW